MGLAHGFEYGDRPHANIARTLLRPRAFQCRARRYSPFESDNKRLLRICSIGLSSRSGHIRSWTQPTLCNIQSDACVAIPGWYSALGINDENARPSTSPRDL